METTKFNNLKNEFNEIRKQPVIKIATYLVAVVVFIFTAAGLLKVITYVVHAYKDFKLAYNRP